jgi:hypothetical protein
MEAAEAAVRRGEAPTLSAYVSEGLRKQLAHDRRLRALAAAIKEYEAEKGVITDEDVENAVRTAQSRAIHMRPVKPYAGRLRSSQVSSRASERKSRR